MADCPEGIREQREHNCIVALQLCLEAMEALDKEDSEGHRELWDKAKEKAREALKPDLTVVEV
jgi:hypothetical protein